MSSRRAADRTTAWGHAGSSGKRRRASACYSGGRHRNLPRFINSRRRLTPFCRRNYGVRRRRLNGGRGVSMRPHSVFCIHHLHSAITAPPARSSAGPTAGARAGKRDKTPGTFSAAGIFSAARYIFRRWYIFPPLRYIFRRRTLSRLTVSRWFFLSGRLFGVSTFLIAHRIVRRPCA